MGIVPDEIKQNIFAKPFRSQQQVAELLGISEQLLEKARRGHNCHLSKLEYTRIGRRILYPASSIMQFIESLKFIIL